MNRRRADAAVAVLVAAVLLGGGSLSWQASRRRRTVDQGMGSMMDGSMQTMYGPDPFWYAFGTLLVAVAVGGVYLLVREGGDATTAGAGSAGAGVVDPPESEGTVEPEPASPETRPRERVLDLLPDDERRVLEPVLDSPGITQIELRDRSEFSKSKVSQTVSGLKERGLLYRERQGRTYRVYPSDDLDSQQSDR
jgi:DNA-binding transcriptional ArsR family regulator